MHKRETFWEVSWYGEVPLDENGDSDFDSTPNYFKDFTTKAAAIKYANKIAPTAGCGEVEIAQWWKKPWPYCVEGWEREYIGEPEYVQADMVGAA